MQLRALFVTAHEALIPTIADVTERDRSMVQQIYVGSFRVLAFLIAPALPLFLGVVPIVSEIWIGSYNTTFVSFAVLLFVGWFLNIAAGPAYFANMGTGELRWNVISHVVNGVLNLGFGILLGWLFGGIGVVIGFVLALIIASSLIAVPYELKYRVGLRRLLEKRTALLGAVSAVALLLMWFLYDFLAGWNLAAVATLMVGSYAVLVFPFFWLHPRRSWLQGTVRAVVSGSARLADQK